MSLFLRGNRFERNVVFHHLLANGSTVVNGLPSEWVVSSGHFLQWKSPSSVSLTSKSPTYLIRAVWPVNSTHSLQRVHWWADLWSRCVLWQMSAAGPAVGGCVSYTCVLLPAAASPGQLTVRQQELSFSHTGVSGQLPYVRLCTGEGTHLYTYSIYLSDEILQCSCCVEVCLTDLSNKFYICISDAPYYHSNV